MSPTHYYVEYKSGNCSMLEIPSGDREGAIEEANYFARAFGTTVTAVRTASAEDIKDFAGATYKVSA